MEHSSTVLGIPGTRLVLVLEGQCARYSGKKSAEYTSRLHLAFARSNKQDELSIANLLAVVYSQ